VPKQTFTATLNSAGGSQTVNANWTLADYTLGTISNAGVFTPQGTIAGTATVIASYGGLTAQTTVTLSVSLSTSLGNVTLPDGTTIPQDASAITAADMAALIGPLGGADAGAPPTIVYPYDKTVFPLGLLAPAVQFAGGAVPAVDFKVSLDAPGFHWDGFGHVGNPAQLQAAIPQAMWDGALASALGPATPTVTLSVVTAAQGTAYGPAQAHLVVAPGKLTGVIYYESYSSDALPDGGGTDFGLWAVHPGDVNPPRHLEPGCVICHGVSAAGNTITAGTDDPSVGNLTGVFRAESDGGYTQLATSPANLPYPITSTDDSRGLGWGTVSPDGTVVLRSIHQFWGGDGLLAWAVPGAPLVDDAGALQPLNTTMTVNGSLNMFVPQYSPDGKHLVYVNAPGSSSPGATSQSIGIVDIATDLGDGGAAGYGSVTLSNPHTIYDSTASDAGATGTFTKVPTFLPDSKSIVFEETVSSGQASAGYSNMLPDYTGVDGELAMLQPAGAGYQRVALANANTGSHPGFSTVNYEPKPLPVQVGGYYWVVFASLRSDGYPTVGSPKKLWVTAISPNAPPGTDPSHPPFTLVNQAIVAAQQSQRAYWALAPCQGQGASCQTDNDCCNGACQPQTPGDPSSPLVCGMPTGMCVQLGGKCMAGQSQDCCNAAAGVQCVGTLNGYGTCAMPAAQ
jgi:hypothetical protein